MHAFPPFRLPVPISGLFVMLAACRFAGSGPAEAQPPVLGILPPTGAEARVRLNSSDHPGSVVVLETSPNLREWSTLGTFHEAVLAYPDRAADGASPRFYRIQVRPRGAEDDWKNQVIFPEESFRSPSPGEAVRWVKFAILVDEPWRVFFQDSARFPFHYDFATQRLTPFEGMDRAAFDAVSLHRENQQVVLGALLYPPRPTFVEYGVQFIGLDPYTPNEIARWFELVKSTVHAPNGAGAVYLPTFEQSEVARTQATAFAERGITVASVDRWVAGNHVYAEGWAMGPLKFFPAAGINAAFAEGRLTPADILLTDGIPAETPLVAGIISLTPSTPNSHTAILAKSFGVPFVHLPDAMEQARTQALVGHRVILRATVQLDEGRVRVIDVEASLTPELEAGLLALKIPVAIDYAPKEPFGAIGVPADTLTPDDIRFFGGKAANFGLLRRALPVNSPSPAVALSFDLWDAFLDQALPGTDRSLRHEIALRLAPFTAFPPDIAALKTVLAGIRDLITDTAGFTTGQEQALIELLGVFDPGRKIRFRSSTNVEDSESFTGAGLYDSYSGCLLDDLDGDDTGPSACDPTQRNERGVFRAIRRVYASFYNDNAFLERLRHQVNEAEVGMGVLVHHSFPDDEELANGVATLDCRYANPARPFLSGDMVTQLGAESVTNPDGSATPEVVNYFRSGSIAGVELRAYSSRVPLGGLVMDWQGDYLGFGELFKQVADGFAALRPEKARFHLDLEFKKDVNLGRVVKQVRELPDPAGTNQTVPFLIDDPAEWVVAQREAGDVFANHRLKSVWALHAANVRLTPPNIARGLYVEGSVDYLDLVAGVVRSLTGSLESWPGASNSVEGTTTSWTTGAGPELRRWSLTTSVVTNVSGTTPPIFTQNDFGLLLNVDYAVPRPTVSQLGEFTTTTQEVAFLEPRRVPGPNDILVRRAAGRSGGVQVEIDFYWPNEPPAAAGYTAPLVRFSGTRITGLTTEPVVLTGYYSQTYRPGHHNFTEEFILEPRLEPGLSPTSRAELEAANIRFLYLQLGFIEPRILAVGADGKFRSL
ncbi:MAG: hypothetical protein KDM81_00240 [Verrucomicrobiae bacterium]|nr:hypothetical protein [Verrucomicrobiae bacterium]